MILLNFTTVLTILVLATFAVGFEGRPPYHGIRKCNGWKSCYNRMQQQENSALQQTVMKINQTLSNQRKEIELLEQEKSNVFI